ncbi:MAG: helix-turn-helix domain-containing protein [Gemmatimonadota bacterium]
MEFRHLDYAPGTPATELGPAALEALLDRGDLDDWAPLARAIADDPWGETAETVLRLCDAHPMYGTSALWRAWIERRRGSQEREATTLTEARERTGLTQTRVAERLGIGQSDVSKLERRSDVLLSTLRAYARAIGARLHVALEGPGDDGPRKVILSPRRD